jgi:phosphatidylglycerophosphatase A
MSSNKPNIYKSNICPPCPPTATAFEKCVYWLGIGLGSGLPKRAAGTWGTVGGVLVAVPVMLVFGFMTFVLMTLIGLIIGSYICGKTSKLMGIDDDPHIVFDEWVGVWIALLPSAWAMGDLVSTFVSFNYLHPSLLLLIVIPFVLFRIFDVLKPFPISWADKRVSGGFGIMLDDVLAGIISAGLFVLTL